MMEKGLSIWLVYQIHSWCLFHCMFFVLIFPDILTFFTFNKICKDKVEAEVWFSGLKALISTGQYGRSKIDGWNNGGLNTDVHLYRNHQNIFSLSSIMNSLEQINFGNHVLFKLKCLNVIGICHDYLT